MLFRMYLRKSTQNLEYSIFLCRFAENYDEMIVAKTIQELKDGYAAACPSAKKGLVPTMGALHEGHLSLISKAKEMCGFVTVSVFVNPTQFNNPEDFRTYPRTLEADCKLLEKAGADMVFAPSAEEIYPEKDTRVFDFHGLDRYGEGPMRPGHFNGVAQIVTKLFDLNKPDCAFFGEKDYQQLAILKRIAKDYGYPIEIVPCPILRADDGLALSSRNKLLTPEQRKAAPHIFRTMSSSAEELARSGYSIPADEFISQLVGRINESPELECEYMEAVDAESLQKISDWNSSSSIRLWGAVYAGKVRLIDNIQIK